jgi:hypothetical protein
MKRNQTTRREIVENCIVRGFLVAGIPMSSSSLFALWQDGHKQAGTGKPTPTEVLGPFFKKGAPNTSNLRGPGDPGCGEASDGCGPPRGGRGA